MSGPQCGIVVALAIGIAAGGAWAETRAVVKTHDVGDSRGTLSIAIDGKAAVSFQYQGTGEIVEAGKFSIPAGARAVQISGRITRTRGGRSLTSQGTDTIPIVDVSPLLQTLRTESPWPRRLTAFLQQKSLFEEKLQDVAPDLQWEMRQGATARREAIELAVRRLGYALPAEHVQILEQFGAWRLGDSFATPAEQLQNAWDQVLTLWEFPRTALTGLPNESQALLRSSVILYTLAGDGYGAILYQPPAPGSPAANGTFYHVEEENLVDIVPLKTPEGRPLTYSEVLISWIAAEGVSRYGSTGEVVLVDPGAKVPAEYTLRVNPDGAAVHFSLDWERRFGQSP